MGDVGTELGTGLEFGCAELGTELGTELEFGCALYCNWWVPGDYLTC